LRSDHIAITRPGHDQHANLPDRLREIVRFCIPFDATVLVVSDDGAPIDLGREAWHFPQTQTGAFTGAYPVDGPDLIAHLEALRARGAQYIVFPATALWWLDHYSDFRRHLAQRYRLAAREQDTCWIFALHFPPDRDYRDKGARDGLALPPGELIAMTIGSYDAHAFFRGGRAVAGMMTDVLSKAGHDVGSFDAILDFGCGCGRVLRHWKDLPARLAGADYNPYLVEWCRKTLPFASFTRTRPYEPLVYEEGGFDFIYAFSVFTHLDLESQEFWLNELKRVLRKDGLLLLTLHGKQFLDGLTDDEKGRFEAGELVVKNEQASGSNLSSAHHPERYIREVLASGMTVLDFVPGSSRAFLGQDVALLRKQG
jgi:SAM-dependent methyltransferase